MSKIDKHIGPHARINLPHHQFFLGQETAYLSLLSTEREHERGSCQSGLGWRRAHQEAPNHLYLGGFWGQWCSERHQVIRRWSLVRVSPFDPDSRPGASDVGLLHSHGGKGRHEGCKLVIIRGHFRWLEGYGPAVAASRERPLPFYLNDNVGRLYGLQRRKRVGNGVSWRVVSKSFRGLGGLCCIC